MVPLQPATLQEWISPVNGFNSKFRGLVLGLSAVALMPAAAFAQDASYTIEQADRGEDAYQDNCGGCHGSTLGGQAEAPGLIGNGFRNSWFTDQTASYMFDFLTSAMPQQAPGSLTPQQYADITAFLMSKNRIPAGATELPPDSAVLATLKVPAATP